MKEGDALASVAHWSAGHRRLVSGDGGVLLEHEPSGVPVRGNRVDDLGDVRVALSKRLEQAGPRRVQQRAAASPSSTSFRCT